MRGGIPTDPYLMEDSESVEERSFGLPENRQEREERHEREEQRTEFLQTSDFHKLSQPGEWNE